MTVGQGIRKRVVVTVALVALVACVSVAAISTQRDEHIMVTAHFADAGAVVAGNEVKAAGVTVGAIESVDLDGDRARVRMTVQRSVLPLHQDATATITDKDLLGERFVVLDRGSSSAPLLEEPMLIPQSQTSRVVDLESIFNAVDDPTGTALAALVTALGEGVDGLGPEIAAGIEALEPALRRADDLGQILGEHNALLAELVARAAPVADAIASDRARDLDRLVDSTEQTMAAVAEERTAVQDALQRLPTALASARRTLTTVAGVADNATPMLASMRPITDDLTQISAELHRFADAADPALAALEPVLTRGEQMLDEAAPVVRALQSSSQDLIGVSHASRILTEEALSKRLSSLMEFLRGWSLSTSQYDGLSHYFRAIVPVTPKVIGVAAAGPIPGAADEPVPELPLPRAPLPPPLGSEDNATGSAADTGSRGADAPSVTGLSEEQENDMLGQLLGGR